MRRDAGLERITNSAPRLDSVPKDQEFQCYICGAWAVTYRTIRVIPPDPHLLRAPANGLITGTIEPTATCGSHDCERKEGMRQDAIFQMLVAPIRDKFYEERERRIANTRAVKPRTEE